MARKPLSELSDWELVDEDQDLRGRKLLDRDGRTLGTIRDMIVDTETGYVEAVVLDDGTTYGAREFELRRGAAVLLDPVHGAPESHVPGRGPAGAPAETPDVTAPLPRAADPDEAPPARRAPPERPTDRADTRVDAEVGTRSGLPADPGPAAPVGRPRPAADVLPDNPDADDRVIVIRLRGEELYVEKVPVVAGEIVLEKRTVSYSERVSDTVRREEVEVVVDDPSSTARGDAAGRITGSAAQGPSAQMP